MTEMFDVKREERRYLPDLRCRAAVWHSEGGEEQRLTCDGLYRKVMRCANDLRPFGIEKGERVCISMSFAPDLIVAAGHNIGTAAVIRKPDALKGNVIKAFVARRGGASPSSGLIDDLKE